MALSAPELIREAIDALTRADAAHLEHLAQEAPAVAWPVEGQQRRTALAERRALGRLLLLTERNLRLLGGDPSVSGSYGPKRN
jgi:hypothetical protein